MMTKLPGYFYDSEGTVTTQNQPKKSAPTSRKVDTFASLTISNFRLLLTGTMLSNAAQWVQLMTLNWLVYDLTGSGTMLGTVNLVRAFATLGMIPVAGILIDHLKRHQVMVSTNCWLFVITLMMGLLLLFGYVHVWYLFVFSFFTSRSARQDDTILAVNTLLLQYFMIFSYLIDGFAYAAEALVGKYTGEENRARLIRTIRYLFYWGLGISIHGNGIIQGTVGIFGVGDRTPPLSTPQTSLRNMRYIPISFKGTA